MRLVFFCRGLIYQAHLIEYINKLDGFNFSYVCVRFFFCRGLIYQAHLIFDFIKGMIDESNPCIKRRGGAQLIKPLLGKIKQKKRPMVSFSFLLSLILRPNEKKRMTIFSKLWRKKIWILMNLS